MTTQNLPHPTAEQIKKFAHDFAKSVGEPCEAQAIVAVNHALNPKAKLPDGIPYVVDPTQGGYLGVIYINERHVKFTIHASAVVRTQPVLKYPENCIPSSVNNYLLMSLDLRQTFRTATPLELNP